MAMDRDDILRRLVTGAEYLERNNLTPKERSDALKLYNALEAEFWRLDEQEKTFQPPIPEIVKEQTNKIREILKPKEGVK